MTEISHYATAEIQNKLPHKYGGELAIPEGLEGSTIVRIGQLGDGRDVEGGGLTIEYRTAGSDETHRVVLAFNECGMWPVYLARLGRESHVQQCRRCLVALDSEVMVYVRERHEIERIGNGEPCWVCKACHDCYLGDE